MCMCLSACACAFGVGMMMAGIGRGPASGPAQFEMAARPRGPPPAGDLRAEFQRAAMAKQAEAQAIQAKLEGE